MQPNLAKHPEQITGKLYIRKYGASEARLFMVLSCSYHVRSYGSQPFVRGFTRIYAKSTGKTVKIPENIFIFSVFFQVFQPQILRKYPRRSCGSFWSKLELRKPKFDRFRSNFPNLFMNKCVFFIAFLVFCYQAGFLATQDPFQTKDPSILIYSVVLNH